MSSFDNYTTPQALLEQELAQRRESGFDTSEVRARIAGTDVKDLTSAEAEDHLAALAIATPVSDWPYVEPTDLEAIVAEFPRDPFGDGVTAGAALPDDLDDRIAGAWLGRCAGNCLGKPVENGDIWSPDALRDYLTATGNYPINDYVTNSPTMPEGLRLVGNPMETTTGNIRYVPRDDDLDYTLLGLHLMERHGRALTTADVADAWLSLLPYGATYTAERATYRTLVAGVAPESAGWRDNPYREWIGAQIRADIYGYVLPGPPTRGGQAGLAGRPALPRGERGLRRDVGGGFRRLCVHRGLIGRGLRPCARVRARTIPTGRGAAVGAITARGRDRLGDARPRDPRSLRGTALGSYREQRGRRRCCDPDVR